jgi:hypothetical protein
MKTYELKPRTDIAEKPFSGVSINNMMKDLPCEEPQCPVNCPAHA